MCLIAMKMAFNSAFLHSKIAVSYLGNTNITLHLMSLSVKLLVVSKRWWLCCSPR